MNNRNAPLRIGIGGAVGTGKTALMGALCRAFRDRYKRVAAITNDIHTKEHAEFLTRAGSLPPERIIGIETGGCPYTAIREDASINLAGVAESIAVARKATLSDSSEAEVPWLVGLRDRALIGVIVYSFARTSAVVAMEVEDYFANGKRLWVRLHEKGGKRHEMPAHHKLEEFLDEYLDAAGIRDQGKTPHFRSAAGRTGIPTDRPLHRIDAYEMVRRRTAEAGLKGKLGCHVFRATGITVYLEAGGTLEDAQAMAAHESPRTTKLYDRTRDEMTLDEVERIKI